MCKNRTPVIVSKECLPDLQNQEDPRNIALDRVGITNVKFPMQILKKDGTSVDVSVKVDLYAGLSNLAKGHNLSRFSEVLLEFSHTTGTILSSKTIPSLLELMSNKLGSSDVYARFEFDYYIEKETPATKIKAPMAHTCAFTGINKNGEYTFILEANVVAASVCPCSREMSLLENLVNGELEEPNTYAHVSAAKDVGMGAHNQRSQIRVQLIPKDNKLVWIEDLVTLIEAQASAPTYPILKRPDEKYVTELGYLNAKFSEDIARDIQLALEERDDVFSWSLKVRNEESIHPFDVASYQQSENWKFH